MNNSNIINLKNYLIGGSSTSNHFTIPEGTTEIREGMIPLSTTSVTIPESVTIIGENAFRRTQLTRVNIGNNVTTIGKKAFADTPLNNVTIGNNVITIGTGAFVNTRINYVIIPNSVTTIENYAFANTRLDSINIPDSVTSISSYAFARTPLTTVTIPDSVTIIEKNAFANTQLSSVTIPDSVTTIESNAFANTQLTNVTIPDSVTTIGPNAFDSNVTINRTNEPTNDLIINTHNTIVPIDEIITLDNVTTAPIHGLSASSDITIDTFLQRLPQIPVDMFGEKKKKPVDINRNDVLGSILNAERIYKDKLFDTDIEIKFIGEQGIDAGGLRREFFTLLGDEIIKKYFSEDEGNYCIIKNEDDTGEATTPIDDYYFIGQLFAYCIKIGVNINIRLHPVLLHMILNSIYDNFSFNINNTKGREMLSLIDSSSEPVKLNLILNYINKEMNYQDRLTTNIDSFEKLKQIMDSYDLTITSRMPLARYFTLLGMTKEEWGGISDNKICLNEAGMYCYLLDQPIDIPFEKKEWFIDFNIRAYIYGKTLEETESFIRGFHNVIEPELLRGLSPKDLNILIAGDSTIDINMFLAGVDFVNVGDKLELIQQIIREYAEEDSTYLNEFLYWITGKKTLPHNGFAEFGRQLQVMFQFVEHAESHTCSDFVYGVLPSNLLVDDSTETSENKLRRAFSKVAIKTYSGCEYNQAGGRNNITLLKNFI